MASSSPRSSSSQPGPFAVCVQPPAQPPVVVLRRAPVVVRLHTFVEYARWSCHSSRCRTSRKAVTPGRSRRCGPRLSGHADVLDVHSDADHNRSVFTLVGDDTSLVESLLAGIACARERDRPARARRRSSPNRRRRRRADRRARSRRPQSGRGTVRCGSRTGSATSSACPVFLYGDSATGAGPRVLPARRPGGAPASNRGGRASPGLRPCATRRARRWSHRRRAPAADRVQREPRHRRRGGRARRSPQWCGRRVAASPVCAHSDCSCREPVVRRSA